MTKETEKLIIRKKQPVVTRHKALLAYLLDKDIIKEGEYKWIEHADYKDVMGQDVIGVLPLQLASYAKSITEVPLKLTPEMRGKELTLEEVTQVAGEPVEYVVRETQTVEVLEYYSNILKGYTVDDYELAYKYHLYLNYENYQDTFRTLSDVSRARKIYFDIVQAVTAILDESSIEMNRLNDREFLFFELSGLRWEAKLVYTDEYFLDEYEEKVYKSKTVRLADFNRTSMLEFIDDLVKMTL